MRFNIEDLKPKKEKREKEEFCVSIKKKFGGAIFTTVLGAALISGGTFALFNSTTTNLGNTFTAGTVVVTDITGGSLASQEVNFDNLAPGDSNTLTMKVKNDGTLDEWVKIDTAASDASKNGSIFEGTTPLTLTYSPDVIKLAPGETYDFSIDYEFPINADNSYQETTGKFNVVVAAVQARNNTEYNGSNEEIGPITWD